MTLPWRSLVVVVAATWTVACGGHDSPEPTVEDAGGGGGSGRGEQGDAGGGLGSRADAAPPQFPVGIYQCTSDLQEYHSGAGGNGTLTLYQAGDVLTATYTGDYAAAGTIELVVTTDGSASPEPGQTFQTMSCAIPSGTSLDDEDVTAGSLTLDGTDLFLELIGTATHDPACQGTPSHLALTCAKGDAG